MKRIAVIYNSRMFSYYKAETNYTNLEKTLINQKFSLAITINVRYNVVRRILTTWRVTWRIFATSRKAMGMNTRL